MCQLSRSRQQNGETWFSPSPFSPPPASLCFKNKNYKISIDPIGGQASDQQHNCGKKRQNVMVVTDELREAAPCVHPALSLAHSDLRVGLL
jgi:hypothetical protein